MLVVRVVVVRTQNFLSPASRSIGKRGSGTNTKFFSDQARVVVVRTQNFLSPDSRGSGTRGSGAGGSFTNANLSKSCRTC